MVEAIGVNKSLKFMRFGIEDKTQNIFNKRKNTRKRKETDCMTNYVAQTFEQKIGNKIVSITSLNPQFSVDEKRKVKLQIEAKLYEVFYKYMSCKP